MKPMISLLLLVAVCHAAEESRSRREEEDSAVKRQLQEGNFGKKIQPLDLASPKLQNGYDDNKNELREGPPQKEYGPPAQQYGAPAQQYGAPQQPVKISDVLSGQGEFPAAIASHLYSPVQVYQPRLGSPTTFEVSQPVRSQLMYSEHKIYQATPTVPTLNQNGQSLPSPPQRPGLTIPFPGFDHLQPPASLRPVLPNDFLPRLDAPNPAPRPDFPQQIYQQVFSQQSGTIPLDIYQQINQLGSLSNFDDSFQESQDEQRRSNEPEKINLQKEQNAGIQYPSQAQNITQGQKIDEQTRESQRQSTQQPQAVSYASFSQGLPASSQAQYQFQQDQVHSSPLPPVQRQQSPLPQSLPLFQPLQIAQGQSTFQAIRTTPSHSTIYQTFNQSPRPIGVVRIGQKQESTTPQTFTVSTVEPQESSTSTVITTDKIDSTLSTTTQKRRTQSTRYFTPAYSRPTLRPFTRPTLAPRSTQSTLQVLRTFGSRPTLPPLSALNRRQQITTQSFSTLPSSTPPQPLIRIQNLPTSPLQSDTQTISTAPLSSTQTLSTLTQQPITQTISTSPTTLQPQLIQSTLTPIPLYQSERFQSLPTFTSTLQPLPQLTTIQPLQVTQPQTLPIIIQPKGSKTTTQRHGVQSEPQPAIQVQEYKSEQKSQQQLSQQLQQPQFLGPQSQFIRESQQIQQQLQGIQQQLQLLQQQPGYYQQPLQIVQQQSPPFQQLVQFTQQQLPNTQQPTQFLQQEPQPSLVSQIQPVQLIQQQPQPTPLPQSQPVHLIEQQSQPTPIPELQPVQLIQQQSQPTPLPQLQPVQLYQQQPQPTPVPQLQPVQLFQQQPQPTPQLQPVQLIQQQPQPTPLPQLQPVQLVQQQPQPTPLPQLQPVQLIQGPPTSPLPLEPQVVVEQNQLIETQPQLIQTPSPPIQSTQQSSKPPLTPQKQSQKEKENQKSENEDKSENQGPNISNEYEAFYNQLTKLQNSIFTEELLIQQPQLLPVPVGFSSYAATPSLLSPLHSAHLHPPHLHSPHLHSHSYHHVHSFPSTQYFGKHSSGIFGGWK